MSKRRKHSSDLAKKDPNYRMLELISKDQQSYQDIQALTSSKTKDQLKVFLVTQAKNELRRVLKLTLWLDQVEDNYMKKVEESMTTDELSLKQYESVLTTIANLLMRSNEIISKVLNDDSLMTILNTTVYTDNNVTNQTTTVITQLSDAHSRERVRNIVNQIIIKAEDYTDVQKPPVDITEINESEVYDTDE